MERSLENKYYKFSGLNLTIETLDGLIKHNGPNKDLKNYSNLLDLDSLKKRINFLESPSLEAQVAAISDDIAYNNHDLEDGLRANLFSLEELKSIKIIGKLINKHIKNIKSYRRELIINQIIRELINKMVIDVIKTTNYNLKRVKQDSRKNIYEAKYPLVNFSAKMKNLDIQIKDFLRENMYHNKDVLVNTNKGKKIIEVLFKYIKKNPKKYINNYLLKKYDTERVIADFIAGMTDRYAINLHKTLK